MSSNDPRDHLNDHVIDVRGVSKSYRIYNGNADRLRQMLLPRLRRSLGLDERRYFREFWALREVTLQVRPGEVVGIVGRNGSGKSTLLQLVCGTLAPDRGDIATRGRISALLELGSGFNPEFTGAENVRLYGAVLGLSMAEIEMRYSDILAFAGIGDFVHQPLRTYSSGMAMRLAFAVAVSVEPRILIVDEALAVGDELFQRKCYSRIRQMQSTGCAILFVSHSGGQVIELCDRAVLLDDGECLGQGAPRDIVTGYHRLLYSPAPDRELARQAVRRSLEAGEPVAQRAAAAVRTTMSPEPEQRPQKPAEFYDPNLAPVSTVEYESRGARIGQPEITALDGTRVNCLSCGGEYNYVYAVVFERECFDVRFGMLIRSMAGMDLGAMGTAVPGRGIDCVTEGTTIVVKFRFRCSFLPGTYFMNAGCSGLVDGQDVFLHRRVDVACFRVLPQVHEEPRAGHVELSVESPCACWETL